MEPSQRPAVLYQRRVEPCEQRSEWSQQRRAQQFRAQQRDEQRQRSIHVPVFALDIQVTVSISHPRVYACPSLCRILALMSLPVPCSCCNNGSIPSPFKLLPCDQRNILTSPPRHSRPASHSYCVSEPLDDANGGEFAIIWRTREGRSRRACRTLECGALGGRAHLRAHDNCTRP